MVEVWTAFVLLTIVQWTRAQVASSERLTTDVTPTTLTYAAHENEVRLVGGSDDREGRVEVRMENTTDWGTVCDSGFDMDDATVACRMLGHGDAEDVRDSSSFGLGFGTIKMANLSCSRGESSLFDCSYDGPWNHSCSHDDDVGLVCKEMPSSSGGNFGFTSVIGIILGIVVGVIALVTVICTIVCVLVCQRLFKPSGSRVTSTVVHTNNMGANNGIVVQQDGAYHIQIQQPPGYPQPTQSQQQPSQIPSPPAYEEHIKPSDGQLFSP
ncbi:PRSS12 [Branchiostoma lanceolatum]|uniref:Soluble scavenger receptor cysteine-rich domain-containing protein SSC5D n=1 Tax=Branchiostoma lanceolatum TaxID=7740 RepID=A0A8J9WHS9_BRALA|nr:PRSS12 [Branchiostoma lanceolatum]